MPGPLNKPEHERFAQAIAKGETMAGAYVSAGYKRNPVNSANEKNAARLKKRPEVQERIAELQAKVAEKLAEKTAIDAAWVLEKAATLHAEAMAAKSYAAAKGALDLIGKHVDVQAFREQIQHSGLIEYRDLSDEEIEARIRAHEAEHGQRPTAH